MPCDVVNIKTNKIDSSWDQLWAAELMCRNLNDYRKNSHKVDINYKKTFVDNRNRPSEAQLYLINQLEAIRDVSWCGITRKSASDFISKYK